MSNKYSEFAIESIIEEIDKRYKEARDILNKNEKDEYYSGYCLAYFEVVEIIKNRIDI